MFAILQCERKAVKINSTAISRPQNVACIIRWRSFARMEASRVSGFYFREKKTKVEFEISIASFFFFFALSLGQITRRKNPLAHKSGYTYLRMCTIRCV